MGSAYFPNELLKVDASSPLARLHIASLAKIMRSVSTSVGTVQMPMAARACELECIHDGAGGHAGAGGAHEDAVARLEEARLGGQRQRQGDGCRPAVGVGRDRRDDLVAGEPDPR